MCSPLTQGLFSSNSKESVSESIVSVPAVAVIVIVYVLEVSPANKMSSIFENVNYLASPSKVTTG